MHKVFLFFRWLIVGVTALLGSAIISTVPAVAQEAAQSTGTSSDFTNASNASRFQDAASKFQQSDNSAANTASGSASVLRQENNGKLTVDGAPANSGTTSSSGSSARLWLSVIFFVSAVGLVLVYVFSKRANKQTNQKAEVLLEEVKSEKPKKSRLQPKRKAKNQQKRRTKNTTDKGGVFIFVFVTALRRLVRYLLAVLKQRAYHGQHLLIPYRARARSQLYVLLACLPGSLA